LDINKIKTRVLILFIFTSFSQVAWADEYTSFHKFNAIHIERNKLLKAATEIFQYVETINGESVTTEGYLELGRGDNSTKLSLPIEENVFEKFPQISYNGHISIVARGGPVSRLNFIFTDAFRIITVSGSSPDHVTGLIKLVDEKLSSYEFYTGGEGFRILLCIIVLFLYWIAMLPIWFRLKVSDEPIFVGISFILFFALFWNPPWPTIFPGFIAGAEISSFLETNSDLFTLLGLVIMMLIPIVSLLYRFRKKPNTQKSH
jgi:hypothetical protein